MLRDGGAIPRAVQRVPNAPATTIATKQAVQSNGHPPQRSTASPSNRTSQSAASSSSKQGRTSSPATPAPAASSAAATGTNRRSLLVQTALTAQPSAQIALVSFTAQSLTGQSAPRTNGQTPLATPVQAAPGQILPARAEPPAAATLIAVPAALLTGLRDLPLDRVNEDYTLQLLRTLDHQSRPGPANPADELPALPARLSFDQESWSQITRWIAVSSKPSISLTSEH